MILLLCFSTEEVDIIWFTLIQHAILRFLVLYFRLNVSAKPPAGCPAAVLLVGLNDLNAVFVPVARKKGETFGNSRSASFSLF